MRRQADAQRVRDGADHQRRIHHGRHVDEPHARGPQRPFGMRDRQREAGLADAADAQQRHQAVGAQEGAHGADLVLAAVEHGRREAQVAGRGVEARRDGRAGGRCGRVDAIVGRRRQQQAVAAPRHGLDGAGAEHLAQRGDVHVEIGLLHDQRPPHRDQQFILGHQRAGARHQRQHQVERPSTDGRLLACDMQRAFGGVDLDVFESVRALHGNRRGYRVVPQYFIARAARRLRNPLDGLKDAFACGKRHFLRRPNTNSTEEVP